MIRQAMRSAARSPRGQTATAVPLPAPTGGWDAVSPLAKMKPDRAIVLDNWFPSTGYVEVRKGNTTHASAMGSEPVETLMVYSGMTVAASKLFAVSDGSIWDVSANDDAIVTSETGLSNNRWQWVVFNNSAGHFLVSVNGSDAVRNYNGSVWSSPSITGSGITSSDFIHLNVHKKRIWFIIKDSLNAAYLPVDAISGTATKFSLGSIFKKGGYLVAMATWTHDAGDGADDHAVFISSEGQVAIYQGTDPSSADTWGLVGVFDLGKPLGYRCFTKVAGDLALVCIDGVLPLSKAIITDRGAATAIAITANINDAMNRAARLYSANFGWELTPYPKGVMALLNVPVAEGATQHQYVMNTLTGAWCRFTGMNANCWAVYKDDLYFGGNAGAVYRADYGAIDAGYPIVAIGQCAYNTLGTPGRQKQITMLQPLITTDSAASPAIGISTDYKDNAVLGTPVSAAIASAIYDDAIWDSATYPIESRNISDWTVVSGEGQAISVHFRADTGPDANGWDIALWDESPWSAGGSSEVVLRLNGFNAIYEPGGLM